MKTTHVHLEGATDEAWEVGVVHAHPLRFMLLQIKTIWRTWMHARKTGQDATRWYGVYKKGNEDVLAQCGIGDDARRRASHIRNLQPSN